VRIALKKWLGWGSVVLALSVAMSAAHAADAYPDKPIRLIVGQAPGGGTDVVARLVAKEMTLSLGQSVVVENRTGAAGSIAASVVSNSAPDGYTVLLVSSSYAIDPNLMKLPFDPMKDLVPVSLLAQVPFLLVVNPKLPVKTVGDLLTLAKQKPGKVTFASGGPDSSGHLAGVQLVSLSKVPMTHVPYRGAGPALVDVIAGQVDFMFASVLSATPLVKQGQLRAIALSSIKRSASNPQLPTVAESGVPGYSSGSWYALLAPKNTPPAVLDKLSAAAAKAVNAKSVRDTLSLDGAEPVGSTRQQCQVFLAGEMDKFRKLVEMARASVN
jgi:tripartite-type tricarboxylate transporter receptor subunit TctC